MTIVDSTGAVLSTGQENFVGADATGDMTATYSTVADGTYFIRLRRADDAVAENVPNRLVVSTELSANAGQLACANPLAINVDGIINLVSQSDVVRLPTSCGPGVGETFVVTINLEEPNQVDISLSGPSLTTSAISVRSPTCDDSASEIACQDFDSIGENPVHTFESVNLPAGESFIVIEALFGDSATLSVISRGLPQADFKASEKDHPDKPSVRTRPPYWCP